MPRPGVAEWRTGTADCPPVSSLERLLREALGDPERAHVLERSTGVATPALAMVRTNGEFRVQVGMRSTILGDSQEDRAHFRRLLERADVFFANKRSSLRSCQSPTTSSAG